MSKVFLAFTKKEAEDSNLSCLSRCARLPQRCWQNFNSWVCEIWWKWDTQRK